VTRLRGHALALGLVAALAGCGGDAPPGRAETLEPIVATAVPARYAEWSDRATALADAVDAACAAADAGAPSPGVVDGLGEDVAALRAAWTRLEPFWIGPTVDRRSKFLVDWPIDRAEVDELLAGDAAIDAYSLRTLVAADQRGLAALAHVLDAPLDARRCDYAVGNAEMVAAEAAALAAEWADFGPTLAADAAAADDALGEIVSETLFITSSLMELEPEGMQRERVEGVRWVFFGDEPPISTPDVGGGAEPAVVGIAPLLDEGIAEQLATELDAALAMPYGVAAMAVEVTIETNVVSGLTISVTFSDADGDGG